MQRQCPVCQFWLSGLDSWVGESVHPAVFSLFTTTCAKLAFPVGNLGTPRGALAYHIPLQIATKVVNRWGILRMSTKTLTLRCLDSSSLGNLDKNKPARLPPSILSLYYGTFYFNWLALFGLQFFNV